MGGGGGQSLNEGEANNEKFKATKQKRYFMMRKEGVAARNMFWDDIH